jgi:hypothetical protein
MLVEGFAMVAESKAVDRWKRPNASREADSEDNSET